MPEYRNSLHFKRPSDTETTWAQPKLTADGVFGSNSFAVSCSSTVASSESFNAWSSFMNTTTYGYGCCSTEGVNVTESNPWIYTMYFPNPTKITNVLIRNRSAYNNMPALFLFQASNTNEDNSWVTLITVTNTNNTNNATWIFTIPTANQNFYRYYRFYVKSTVSVTGYCSLGFPTITAVEKKYTTYEVPLYTLASDTEVSGKAAPVLMNKNTVYAAYGDSSNASATNINCKLSGDSTVRRLLTYQVPTGSYTFSKPGTYTMTFTVPSGVKVLYCVPGTMPAELGEQSAYASDKNKYWFYASYYDASSGETWSMGYTESSHYVAVTPGKTYTLHIVIDEANTYPTIYWSREINGHSTDVSDL